MTHKLNSPHEWLLEKAQNWNTDALYKALSGLAYQLTASRFATCSSPKWKLTAILRT